MTKAESSSKPGVLTSRPYRLLDREVDADPVEERRLPDPLGGVEQELADLALEQGHVKLGGAVQDGGDVEQELLSKREAEGGVQRTCGGRVWACGGELSAEHAAAVG